MIRKLSLAVLLALFAVASPAAAAVSDQQITDAVNEELNTDPAVQANRIDVKTQGGLVTLSGSVMNLLAKDRAGRIAAAVKGVVGVDNKIKVRPKKDFSDSELAKAASRALANNPATEDHEINLAAKNGIVTLKGRVDSFQERQIAGRVVAGVNGVREIVNDLEISRAAPRPDSEIAAEVRQLLRYDIRLNKGPIEVSVNQQKVNLSGGVGSLAEKNLAITRAYVLGVQAVDASKLNVDPDLKNENLRMEAFTEPQIKDGIKAALAANPWVEAENVSIDYHNGVATLRGSVDSLAAKYEAYEEARYAIGVNRVKNHLKVRPANITDVEIENRVRDAILLNPYLEPHEPIRVNAENGTLFLAGNVDSQFEKNEALRVAANTVGVEEVVNYLQVTPEIVTYTYYYNPLVDDLYFDHQYLLEPVYTSKTDREIEEDINDQMFWSPFVDADEVQVEVENGMATLQGSVDSFFEMDAAVENAWEGGAAIVSNQLIVRY